MQRTNYMRSWQIFVHSVQNVTLIYLLNVCIQDYRIALASTKDVLYMMHKNLSVPDQVNQSLTCIISANSKYWVTSQFGHLQASHNFSIDPIT